MADHPHGGRKPSDVNARLDTANCSMCQRRKRTVKLVMTRAGWCCKRCLASLTNGTGDDQ